MYKTNYVTRDMLEKALKNKVVTIEIIDNLPDLIDRKDKYSKLMMKLDSVINKSKV